MWERTELRGMRCLMCHLLVSRHIRNQKITTESYIEDN
jgi:hypothetical protein